MARNPDLGRNVAVGCLMMPLGFVSGAMVAVLLSVVVAYFTREPRCADVPSCNWHVYAALGGLAGMLSLPALVVRRLVQPPLEPARGDAPATPPDASASV